MKNFTVRGAEPKDAEVYTNWLLAAAGINLLDAGVYRYPTCNTAVVEKDGEPVLINSVHLVLMQEALAPKPGLSPMDEARALKTLHYAIQALAERSGTREVWFGCKDKRLIKFATKHGYEVVPFPMLRWKVGVNEEK